MGSKFEKFSVIVFIILTVIAGIFIAHAWGSEITAFNRYEFDIENNNIVINGTIEEINKPNGDNFYIKISGKSYNIDKYFPNPNSWLGSSNDEDMELFYYTAEIGDNITIYKSNKIVLNGEIYQNSVFETYSWFAWLITFIVVTIIGIILIIYLVMFVGYIEEDLKDDIKGLKRKVNSLEHELTIEKEKYNKFLVGNSMKLGASIVPTKYCNNCGSEVDLKESHCKYCGTEVRLK